MTFSIPPNREGAKPGPSVALWGQLNPSFRYWSSTKMKMPYSIRLSGKILLVLSMRIRRNPSRRKKQGR